MSTALESLLSTKEYGFSLLLLQLVWGHVANELYVEETHVTSGCRFFEQTLVLYALSSLSW
jgi:hypothetical protein